MKNLVLIVSVSLLMLLGGSKLFAQRSNSAVQTVTFGVSRSPLASINSAALVRTNISSNSVSVPTTLRDQFATLPLKITFSNGSANYTESTSLISSEALIAGSLSPVASKAIPQVDLRHFFQSADSSPLITSTLVVTITE